LAQAVAFGGVTRVAKKLPTTEVVAAWIRGTESCLWGGTHRELDEKPNAESELFFHA